MVAPPPIPSKPKHFSSSGASTFSKPTYSTGTFPGKVRPVGGHLRAPGVLSSHSNTLPLPNKQENPPAAAIRPYTPDLSEAPPTVLQKPQTLAASSIYSMYTQQATPGKGYQPGGHGTLPRSQPRGTLRYSYCRYDCTPCDLGTTPDACAFRYSSSACVLHPTPSDNSRRLRSECRAVPDCWSARPLSN